MKNVLFILGQLTDLDTEWLAAAGKKVALTRGATLIAEGEAIDAISIVLEGELVVTLEKERRELGRMGPGEIVGEMSFIDARPPSATVKAAGDSQVLRIARTALNQHLHDDDGFAARFYRAVAMMLSDRLRTANARNAKDGDEDELDENFLDAVSLAGDRFGRILRRLADQQ